ncbi:hypothetical protein GS399_08325 [Pedobacter sp. HMF7647]|uniref:Uncharacterized protein n=1 Tax=Hufsiella arboris TaxID=2695275 RepID=A0A7K1Y8R8_9SPHI|nr:hypothetical protein [Hufsiella arboris]MXV50975.1 hypothetical protein [Hufsiella arboris]
MSKSSQKKPDTKAGHSPDDVKTSRPRKRNGASKAADKKVVSSSQDVSPKASDESFVKSPAPSTEEINPQKPAPVTDMEVHHHPRLDHNPKPWKEYLLEGFMIFVAVMMGFIAENIREEITNNEHTRQLTSQLVTDLKADTVHLNEIYEEEKKIMRSNDSLFSLLSQPLKTADMLRIQKAIIGSHNLWPFHPSAGAVSAIKNELHLKQFSESHIIKYISAYEAHTELVRTVQDIALQYQRNFLDPFLRYHFTPDNLNAAFYHSSPLTAQMRNLNQENLTQLRADMVLIRINTKELIDDNRKLKADAVSMLEYVVKQYNLDEK